MRSVKFLIAVGAASLLSSVASAADAPISVPPPPPPPLGYGPPPSVGYGPPPAVAYGAASGYGGAAGYGRGLGYGGGSGRGIVDAFDGWYLRGDIGFTSDRVGRLNNALDSTLSSSTQSNAFSSANSFSAGFGTRFNDWFRADLTGEFRGSSQFSGTERITFPGGFGADTYRGRKNEWLVMANGYVDLGTWFSLTPFIGAGIGGARVTIADFIDMGITNSGNGSVSSFAFGDNVSKWNLAWALHAGVSYKLAPNFTIELAYRYLDMGDGLTGDLRTFDGVNNIYNPMTFKNLRSNDLRFGVRWDICPPANGLPTCRRTRRRTRHRLRW